MTDLKDRTRADIFVRHTSPQSFVSHAYETQIGLDIESQAVWNWLNDPDTFVKGQIWPFKVEFVAGSGEAGGSGFTVGVQNVHHGPLLNCAGEITKVTADDETGPRYRDLQYYYGSFIISHRLIRPTRLEFWVESAPTDADQSPRSIITLRVESFVKPSFAGLWTRAQSLFWKRFFAWTARSAVKHHAKVHPAPREAETSSDDNSAAKP